MAVKHTMTESPIARIRTADTLNDAHHISDPRLAIPTLKVLNGEIIECRRCPRLVAYREQVALMRRRAFRDWEYWGRPVPGFGGSRASLYIIGLAPAAHGGNRTGRLFTGDRSGDFLFRALYRGGFANQPTSQHRDDGLRLIDAYIGASLRCAPPANKPLPAELQNCRPFFERELTLLKPKAVLALGGIALRAYLGMLRDAGLIGGFANYRFAHNQSYKFPAPLPRLFLSYHPSQQNTFTGKLTPAMLNQVLRKIRRFIEAEP